MLGCVHSAFTLRQRDDARPAMSIAARQRVRVIARNAVRQHLQTYGM
jgi:hypothetical protein